MRSAVCAAALALTLSACSPTTGGTWNRPRRGDAPPAAAESLRTALVQPGLILLHQVAVDSPQRSDVLIGRMKIEAGGRWQLHATAPIGMHLFTVGWDGSKLFADVAEPLKGKFPAEGLARDIHQVYFGGCPGRQLTCTLAPGKTVREQLAAPAYHVTSRTVTEPGHVTTITYDEYAWWGPLWHPRRIKMAAGEFKVEILLSGVEKPN